MRATQESTSPAVTSPPVTSPAVVGLGPIGLFLAKTVIVSAAIVVSAWIVLEVLDDFASRRMQQLEQTLRSAMSIGGRQFWTKLEGELDRLAGPTMDLPPEKKQKLLSQIRVVSDRWRPFIVEMASAIDGGATKSDK
jgi:hypothetical protein